MTSLNHQDNSYSPLLQAGEGNSHDEETKNNDGHTQQFCYGQGWSTSSENHLSQRALTPRAHDDRYIVDQGEEHGETMRNRYQNGAPHSQSLYQSWNGNHDNTYRDTPRKRLSQSMTVNPILNESQRNGIVPDSILGLPVKMKEADDDDVSQKGRQRRLMTSMSVALLCYMMGLLSLVPVQSQYLFQRFAEKYFNLTNVTSTQVPCANGRNDSLQDDVNVIQKMTSQQILYMDYTQFIPAIFVSLVVGSYADYIGRKYLVVVPFTGAFLKALVLVLVINLDLDVNYLYIGFTVEGLTGSLYVLLLGLSASIADVTTSARQRVLLFAVLEVLLAFAGAISQIGTGYLIKGLGFGVPSIILCCLLFTGAVVLLAFMPETLNKPDHIVLNPAVHLRKVFGFYFFDGTVLQRALFGCILLIFFLIAMINLGKMSVETLYELNSPFCWDSVKIGIFTGVRLFVQNLAGVLTLKTLSKYVRLEIIGLLGLLSGAAGFAVEAFSKSDFMMYLSGVIGLLVTVVSPIVRTLMSRMAPAKSQGALFASVAAMETICHLTSTTVYNQVYTATLNVFSGAVFTLMTAILLLDFVLLILYAVLSHKTLFYQDLARDVDIDIAQPSSSSSSSSSLTQEESQPLLHNQERSLT